MAIAIVPNQTVPTAAAPTPDAAKPVTSGPKSAAGQAPASNPAPTDTVKISTAAQKASQEAQETPAQTAKEAGHGDQQAIYHLERHSIAERQRKVSEKSPEKVVP